MAKQVFFTKLFKKNYKKRFANNLKLREQIKSRIDTFLENPDHPSLRNHRLAGTRNGERAFSISGDIRIIFYEQDDAFVFIDIGTHSQVY